MDTLLLFPFQLGEPYRNKHAVFDMGQGAFVVHASLISMMASLLADQSMPIVLVSSSTVLIGIWPCNALPASVSCLNMSFLTIAQLS